MQDLCVMNLMALGVAHKRAIAAVRNAAEDIMLRGPVSLPWWKPSNSDPRFELVVSLPAGLWSRLPADEKILLFLSKKPLDRCRSRAES